MNTPTPIQRLSDLYRASTLAHLPAQDHANLQAHAQELEAFIKAAEAKTEAPAPTPAKA